MELHYSIAQVADLPEIVDIYNSTIASRMVTADTEPQTVASKMDWLEAHNATSRPLWVVRNASGEMLGWLSFMSFYGRPAYDQTVELSIYISAAHRGKGLGKTLLQFAITEAKQRNIHNLLAFVFKHNIPSVKLFEQFGFAIWGDLPHVAILDDTACSLLILGLPI